jgi:hypothetical protein
MSMSFQWWTRWFDEQSVLCGVSRADGPWGAVRNALTQTPSTTALIAEIILNHELEPALANNECRDRARTPPR